MVQQSEQHNRMVFSAWRPTIHSIHYTLGLSLGLHQACPTFRLAWTSLSEEKLSWAVFKYIQDSKCV